MQTASDDSAWLVVDLDGTLVATDTLWESVFMLLKQKPQAAPRLLSWLLLGKASFKELVASEVRLPTELVPLHEEVVEYVKRCREAGMRTLLATAAHNSIADAIASRTGLFDMVVATDGRDNLRGAAKLQSILDSISTGSAFEYIGDSQADMPVWKAAKVAHVVDPSSLLIRNMVAEGCNLGRVFRRRRPVAADLFEAMRLHQWLKNGLIFVPMVLAHAITQPVMWLKALLGFISFGFCASAVYLTNDLFDIYSDRAHPQKRQRALASGALQISHILLSVPTLLLLGLGLALGLDVGFFIIVVVYVGLTTAYTIALKKLLILDVLTLALLYTLRLFAGGELGNVAISEWLISFSMFFFLSLALAKRFAEYANMQDSRLTRRGYCPDDLPILRTFGATSGVLSILVLALYITSDTVSVLYARPGLLWLVCLVLTYWIMRLWTIAGRGHLNEDPVIFAIKDRISYIAAVVVLLIGFMASW